MTPDQIANLERFAARALDANVIGLMLRMVRNGQRADRKGDTATVEQMQQAYDVYHAEALRRGLVSQ